jgi:ABC-type branched-subunit amino acid transport system permease subunit
VSSVALPRRGGRAGGLGWLAVLAIAIAFPMLIGTPYYVRIGITALIFVTLAVAFDLVVGRIGALSLAQPLFYGFGSYFAAIMSTNTGLSFWVELLLGMAATALLAVLIGIPSFRFSLHTFAIGTLGFLTIGQLVALNWMDVTRGTLCIIGVEPMRIPYPGGSFVASSLTAQYFVILGIAAVTVGGIWLLIRTRLGLAFTGVRDDPVLASARGLWPTEFRLAAFGLSGALSAAAGIFAAHFQTVVCPSALDFAYTTALLIMVFIGGRASLRGVVIAAIAFTVIPELLRVTIEWRLAIYGAILLIVVTTFPDGVEHALSSGTKRTRRLFGGKEKR